MRAVQTRREVAFLCQEVIIAQLYLRRCSRAGLSTSRYRYHLRYRLARLLARLSLYEVPRPPLDHIWPTASILDGRTFEEQFRLTKGEFSELFRALRMPERLCIRQRIDRAGRSRNEYIASESGLLLLLRRLAYPARFCDLESFFGHDVSTLSRVFTACISYLHDRYSSCLRRLILADFIASYSALGIATGIAGLAGFVDGTARTTCRPAYLEGALFSGYHDAHCLLWQGLVLACGLIFLDGPHAGHNSDVNVLHAARQTVDLAAIFAQLPEGAFVLGDGIYPVLCYEWLHSTKLSTPEISDLWGDIRASNEHAFHVVTKLWAFTDWIPAQKVFGEAPAQTYETAVLLTNLCNCLRPNQVAQRFRCQPPSVEEYLRRADA